MLYGFCWQKCIVCDCDFWDDLFRECCFISIPDGATNNIKTSLMLHARFNMRLSVVVLFFTLLNHWRGVPYICICLCNGSNACRWTQKYIYMSRWVIPNLFPRGYVAQIILSNTNYDLEKNVFLIYPHNFVCRRKLNMKHCRKTKSGVQWIWSLIHLLTNCD